MNARIFVGERQVDAWPIGNRLESYGDGLFETMRVLGGEVPWWNPHWNRLAHGASRLRITLPEEALVRQAAASLFDDAGDGVLKLLLGRGGVARGYAPTISAAPPWMLSRHAVPKPVENVSAHWCRTRWSVQPALAGIKHCNRLEQVLARGECEEAGTDEGLMLDTDGNVVSATAANVFVLRDGRWWTPSVARCGVAGVCRAHLIGLLQAAETDLSPAQLEAAESVFLCNAVRGILPIARLETRTWSLHPAIAEARRLLASVHPAMAVDAEDSATTDGQMSN
jgi:4-amino-4-deoxychorismate lyase